MDRMCSWRLCVSIASCGRKLLIDRLRGFKRFLPLLSAGDESREHLFQARCFINIYDASLHAQTQVNYPNSMHRCTNYMVSSCEKALLWEHHQSTNLEPQGFLSFNLEKFGHFLRGNPMNILHLFLGKTMQNCFFLWVSGTEVLPFGPNKVKASKEWCWEFFCPKKAVKFPET